MSSEFTQRDAENVTEAQEKLRKLGERQDEAQQLTPNRFPAHYFAKKKDEEKIRLVQDYVKFLNTPGQLTDATKGGVAALYTPTEDDINVIMRKDAEQRLVGFEAFLEKFFDLKNPIHQKILNDVYPQYYDRRLEIINDNLKLQEKMARLKLYGPQTQEDIFFLFALWQGDITIPTSLASSLDEKTFDEAKYARGMFNAKKWAAPTIKVKAGDKHMGTTPLFKHTTDTLEDISGVGPWNKTGGFDYTARSFKNSGVITTAAQGRVQDPNFVPAIMGPNAVFGRQTAGRAFVASLFNQ